MTKQNKLNFVSIYKILLSISIIIAGIFLIIGCLHIYFSGDGYSRQIVASTFSKICIPIYVCIALIIGNFVINFVFIDETRKAKFFKIKNFKQNAEPKLSSKNALIIKIVILIIGVCIFVFGMLTGGYNDVLTKAVNICTECIGLG